MGTLTKQKRNYKKANKETYLFVCYARYSELLGTKPYLTYEAFLEKEVFPFYTTKLIKVGLVAIKKKENFLWILFPETKNWKSDKE